MGGTLRLALNHMVASRTSLEPFFAMAAGLGVGAVEIRNDLKSLAIADGTPAADVSAAAKRHGLAIISINALQRFNDWNSPRADEARALADYAEVCGAEALVLCPVNDTSFCPDDAARLNGLRQALAALAPLLKKRGIVGLVEPLGFAESSLRLKQEAIDAIDDVGAAEQFKLVHDTFHHAIAGETRLFPQRTGLVHVSGVEDQKLPLSAMRDPHRVLIGPGDRLDTIGQLRRLAAGGYDGFVSFEPFAEPPAREADIASGIRASMNHLSAAATSKAA